MPLRIKVEVFEPAFTGATGEKQRKKKLGGGGIVRDTTMVEGQGNNIFGFEGSQAVPASPSGKGETCIQD
jgi:hypothetical protein